MWVEPRAPPVPCGWGAHDLEESELAPDEKDQLNTPFMRLLRLWLWSAPLIMLAIAIAFAVVAINDQRWGLLAAMLAVTLVALGLFLVQWWMMRRISR